MSVRYRNGRMRLQSLRDFSTQLHHDAMEDDKEIDFSSVGLYISGLQSVFAIGATAIISVLCCWVLPSHTISAVRTLAICSISGLAIVKTPLRVGRVRGVSTVFNALRPSVVIYLLALVLEQLVHTCLPNHAASDNTSSTLRYAIYHATSALMVLAGFVRARKPRSESDVPFLMAAAGVIGAALLPPPGTPQHGPLCEEATLLEAGERVVRALLFAATYVVLVYASAPTRNTANELFVCVARTVAASIWVLTTTTWLLPLSVVQIILVLYTRLREDDGHSAPPSPSAINGCETFERVPLHDSMTPDRSGSSDVDAYETGNGSHMLDVEAIVSAIPRLSSHTAQRNALQSQHHHASNAHNGTLSHTSPFVPQTPGISFPLFSGAAAPRTPSVNFAAIAAREARNEGSMA